MDVPVQQDGVTTLAAADYNQTNTELEALIETSGQTKSAGDLVQVEKAVQQIAVSGQFYVDSGAVNIVTLANPNNPILEAYRDGATVKFIAANTNTGASTLTIDSLATINIKRSNGNDLQANDLIAAIMYEAVYIASVNSFVLTNIVIAEDDITKVKEMARVSYVGSDTAVGVPPTSITNQVGITSIISANPSGQLGWLVTFANTYTILPLVTVTFDNTNGLGSVTPDIYTHFNTTTDILVSTVVTGAFSLNGFTIEVRGTIA